jgi:heavy metal translocating P-type ATPase
MDVPVVCVHCGLPVPGRHAPTAAATSAPEYCCFGCRLAADLGREAALDGELGRTCLRLALSIFLSLNVMIFTMWLWTHDVYGPAGANSEPTAIVLWNVCRYACLVFSLPVLWMLGRPVAEGAWQSLRRGAPTTDLLLIAGTLAAFAYSALSTVRGDGPVYFEVGCAVLVLVTLGRWLEARGKQQASEALDSLEKLLPSEVRKCTADGLQNVPLATIEVGDRLVLRAGERVPTDARIVRGVASIDSRVLTGESVPVVRETGDELLGGTLNLDGDLTIEVTASPHGGTWQRLLDCMRTARSTRGRYQQSADLVARWFMPGVAVVALAAFCYHASTANLDQGLLAGLAVVLVACPCALGLATPLALWAALGSAARAQVLFRNGEALERLAGVRVAAFDKTGTLTDGRPALDRFVVVGPAAVEEIIGRTLAAASQSTHDLSLALAAFCRERHIGVVPPCDVRTQPGRGLSAQFADLSTPVFVGNERWMQENHLRFEPAAETALAALTAAGAPLVCIGWNGVVQAVGGFAEQLRRDAAEVIATCRALGLNVEVLTGDHAGRGEQLSRLLNVPVRAGLLPADKVAALGELRRAHGSPVMIGDGLNDAPALTAADVGIALGCGADVSRQSADVCLLSNDLSRVPWSIGLARQTIRVVRQNLFWSFFYNTLGIALAAAGQLNPIWAAAAMVVGGLGVVGNSLRLSHYPPPGEAISPANDRLPPAHDGAKRALPESIV